MRFQFKKILSIFLLIVIIFPFQLFAQGSTGAGGGASISGTHVIGAALKCIGVDSIMADIAKKVGNIGKKETEKLVVQTVPTYDEYTKAEAEKIKEQEKKANKKEQCTDGIVRAAVLEVMDAFTQDIVNWINTGFEGEPSFIKNDGSFWKGIADQEIEGFAADIGFDANLYPFGRDYLISMITNTQSYFRQKAAYSLDRVIGHGQQDNFHSDLAVGGWVGWEALAEPQNNPFGFELIAEQEISKRTAGTSSSSAAKIQKELDINMGFRSAKKCVEPEDYQKPPAGWSLVEDKLKEKDMSLSVIERNQATERIRKYTCLREEVQTPGKVISDQLTNVLNAPLERLQLADEMNEDITAILDALMNQLIQKGLTSLTTAITETDTFASGGNFSAYAGLNQNPGNPGYQNWSNGIVTGYQPPNLGSTDPTDPNSSAALLVTQEAYMDTLAETATNIQSLITKIYQLDYCIPGPRPDWFDYANQAFSQLFTNGNIQNWGDVFIVQNDPQATQLSLDQADYYTNLIQQKTGVNISASSISDAQNIDSYNEYNDVVGQIWTGYITQIGSRYSSQTDTPEMREEAEALYMDIPDLEQLYAELQQTVIDAAIALTDLQAVALVLTDPLYPIEMDSDSDGITDIEEAYAAFDLLSPNLPTQGDLDSLEETASQISSLLNTTTGFLNVCKTEVSQNGYGGDKGRLAYPVTLLSPVEQSAALPPGGVNSQNFLIGPPVVKIVGDDESTPSTISIFNTQSLGGQNVTNQTELTTFESTLNSFIMGGVDGILY